MSQPDIALKFFGLIVVDRIVYVSWLWPYFMRIGAEAVGIADCRLRKPIREKVRGTNTQFPIFRSFPFTRVWNTHPGPNLVN